jgi:hypothetical protein
MKKELLTEFFFCLNEPIHSPWSIMNEAKKPTGSGKRGIKPILLL